MTWHKAVVARPHPLGRPFGYCVVCAYVVVRFQDRWWHLTLASQARARREDKPAAGKGVDADPGATLLNNDGRN